MDITIDELVQLLYTPMTDDKMIEAIDELGAEQPMIDEQYEMDLFIDMLNISNSGLDLSFKEIEGYSQNGELSLCHVSSGAKAEIGLPFGIKKGDSYADCCKKLGSKADFLDEDLEELRVWVKTLANGMKYTVAIAFYEEDLEDVYSVVSHTYTEDRECFIKNNE